MNNGVRSLNLASLIKAMQDPASAFMDASLRGLSPRVDPATGKRKHICGGQAGVFQFVEPNRGLTVAVRAPFGTYRVEHIQRNDTVMAHLSSTQQNASYLLPGRYFAEGLLCDQQKHPILVTPWIEGCTLQRWALETASSTAAGASQSFIAMADQLIEFQAELRNRQVALVDGSGTNHLVDKSTQKLFAIDYLDGTWIPSLSNEPTSLKGHASFAHPDYGICDYGPTMGAFTAWLLQAALHIGAADPAMYASIAANDIDSMLFSADDLKDPKNRAVFKTLLRHRRNEVRVWTQHLIDLLKIAPSQSPPVDATTVRQVRQSGQASPRGKGRQKLSACVGSLKTIVTSLNPVIEQRCSGPLLGVARDLTRKVAVLAAESNVRRLERAVGRCSTRLADDAAASSSFVPLSEAESRNKRINARASQLDQLRQDLARARQQLAEAEQEQFRLKN